MRGTKYTRYLSIVVALLALGFVVGRLSVTESLAASGTLDSPGPPGSTYSYTLEDIYDRLDTGAAGSPSTFTEPTGGPTAGTGHTLSETMAIAPAVDTTDGAIQADVLASKTFWGLGPGSGQWGLTTGTRPAAPVHKTGQTKCYDAGGTEISCTGTGQDGEYQKGVAWPNPRFTDNGDGTITDNLTGLIWLKNANCFGLRSWTQALSDANGLANGSCGLTDGSSAGDWRLPNVRELHSLVHYGANIPALPNTAGTGEWTEGDPFTGIQSVHFCWSSTTNQGARPRAWYVYMRDGAVSHEDKTFALYVWPVRGGQ